MPSTQPNYPEKVHWAMKLTAFVGSVFTLSLFFAGWRQIHEASNLANWFVLVGGTVLTILLLGLQGYWVYFEEKAKGTLRKQIKLFERIHLALAARSGVANLAEGRD